MNATIKNILKALHIYHPLQSSYRNILFNIKKRKNRKQYNTYKGSGYTCNICGATYRKFVPDYPLAENSEALSKNKVIAGYGDNIFCPACMSTARERLVLAMLRDVFNIDGKAVLHLSPLKNIFNFLKKSANVISSDISPGFYKIVDDEVLRQDATQLDFSSNYFDLVIGNHILEHIPDDRKAMQEIFRVLKPAGKAILQVPYSEIIEHTLETPGIHDPAMQSTLYGQRDHVRIYSLNDYMQRLRDTGFDVELIHYNALSEYYRYAIQPGEHFLKIVKPFIS